MHQQLPFKRTDRVGQQIKSILGEIVLKHISLNQIGFITFTSVDVSADLRNAKVFFSVLNPKIKIEAIENEMNPAIKISPNAEEFMDEFSKLG